MLAAIANTWPASGGVPWQQLDLIVRATQRVPVAERQSFASLCRPLVEAGRPDLLSELADTPAVERLAHRDALLVAQGPEATDTENVMKSDWQLAVDRSFDAVGARFAAEAHAWARLDEVIAHVDAEAARPLGEASPVLARRRGGATELQNAQRVLSGALRGGDYSVAVREDTARAGQVSLVWHAIGAYRGHALPKELGEAARHARIVVDQANMRHGLVMALAQSIEDDGHRVCGTGQRQRLISVLQGFYPEVQVDAEALPVGMLLSALGQEFARGHGDAAPSEAALATFRAHALEQATLRYGAAAPEREKFAEDLKAFIALQYGDP